MSDKKQAWTEERCMSLVYHPGMFTNSRCSKRASRDGYCGVHHPDAQAKREAKRREKSRAVLDKWAQQAAKEQRTRACVNALAGIENPAEWREAVERLVRAVGELDLPRDDSPPHREEIVDAYFALLALQSPREEEKSR